MNRFLTLMAVALTLSLSSCMKSSDYKAPPTAGGVSIYNIINNTNNIALDPLSIAIRLNVLLYEASQPGAAEKLEDIVVGNDIKVKDKLFGNSTISKSGDNYTITYQSGYGDDKKDYQRRGNFIIHTGGNLLYSSTAAWTVEMGTGTDHPYIYGGNSTNLYYGESTYTLHGSEAGSLSCYVTFGGYTDEKLKADWRSDVQIDLGDKVKGYLSLKEASRIELSYDASGDLMNIESSLGYQSSMTTDKPLVYKPACGAGAILEGKITAVCPPAKAINPQDYPSDRVEVTWTAGTDCHRTIDIAYNGAFSTQQY